jgi:hypothetical protein
MSRERERRNTKARKRTITHGLLLKPTHPHPEIETFHELLV